MLLCALCYNKVKLSINKKEKLFWMGRQLFYIDPGFEGTVLPLHLM